MKRSGFKPRKESLRDAQIRKMRAKGTKTVWDRNGKALTRKPIKKMAKSRREQMKTYYAVRREFLSTRPDCECCLRRRESGEDILLQPATENHHFRGRIGRLLCDTRFFVAVCFQCSRFWIHQNVTKARDIGVLCQPRDWNVYPGL